MVNRAFFYEAVVFSGDNNAGNHRQKSRERIKDNIDVAGMPTTAGTPALQTWRPSATAPVAQAVIDAGALVFGKANMHELAVGITSNNAHYGPVRNPHDRA